MDREGKTREREITFLANNAAQIKRHSMGEYQNTNEQRHQKWTEHSKWSLSYLLSKFVDQRNKRQLFSLFCLSISSNESNVFVVLLVDFRTRRLCIIVPQCELAFEWFYFDVTQLNI